MKAEITYNSKCVGFKNRVISLFYEILAEICEFENVDTVPPMLQIAISYIRANFKNSALSVPDICRNCAVSETALRKIFKTCLNKSPVEYITELRLENAKELILLGTSVQNAALQSGVLRPEIFFKTCKKAFRMHS